jgi:hypothetical protein
MILPPFQVFMHSGLMLGYLIISTWAYNVICAPDIFSWYFSFVLLNSGQLLYIVYHLRPIAFDPALEEVYEKLFKPFQITRQVILSTYHARSLVYFAFAPCTLKAARCRFPSEVQKSN